MSCCQSYWPLSPVSCERFGSLAWVIFFVHLFGTKTTVASLTMLPKNPGELSYVGNVIGADIGNNASK